MKRLLGRLREVRDAFPPDVRLFLLRAFVLFIVWKSLYLFLWQKPRTLDEPLSRSVGRQTAWTLNLLNGTNSFSEREIYKSTVIEGETIRSPMSYVYRDDRKVIGIADNCNGLELLVLYMGFILAMPASWQRKAAFGLAGMLIVHCVNILRCVGLGSLMLHMREYFEFAHHYIFKMVIYATIFLLWVRFSRHIVLSKSDHAAVQ
jgi:exosortase family protein XrtF